jgi:hypothetical protein
MRLVGVLAAAAVLCGCSGYEGCPNLCAGGVFGITEYLCDGGFCPVDGGTGAVLYDQCICTDRAGVLHSFRVPAALDSASCATSSASWAAFRAATCG